MDRRVGLKSLGGNVVAELPLRSDQRPAPDPLIMQGLLEQPESMLGHTCSLSPGRLHIGLFHKREITLAMSRNFGQIERPSVATRANELKLQAIKKLRMHND